MKSMPGKRFWLPTVMLALCFSAVRAEEPRIVSVEKIWDQAPHNAFTDLIRFRERWFCTFREGERHAGGQDGRIRVITSPDGRSWESAALLTTEGVDLRDPKLSRTPDGRLMLVAGGSIYRDDAFQTRVPRVAFSPDGFEWTSPQRVLAEEHWLWRITWHKGTAYSVSKMGDGKNTRRVILYSSRDGVEWDWITVFRNIPPWPNEATIRFLPDDEMVILLRRNSTGWIGASHPPYRKWTWTDTGHRLGGPNFIRLPDGRLWAGSRAYTQDPTTVLARMTRNSFEPVLTLPSGGDTSYPGLVWHEGLLWVSYYSSHEGKSSIYLAKVRLPSP